MKKIILMTVMMMMVSVTLISFPVFVNCANTGTENGSASNPYNTIQEGIDNANDGDMVVVMDGVYSGAQNRNISWSGKHLTVRSQNGADDCIINGASGNNNRAFILSDSNIDNTDKIEGFTIRSFLLVQDKGAGILIYNGASPIVDNCIFEYCTIEYSDGESYGSGIYCENDSEVPIKIQNCIFDQCYGGCSDGGVGIASQGNVLIDGCTFQNNELVVYAGNCGAAAYQGVCILILPSETTNPIISNNSFIENTAYEGTGSGIYIMEHEDSEESIKIINNYFSENSSYNAVIYIEDSGREIEISGNIFDNNSDVCIQTDYQNVGNIGPFYFKLENNTFVNNSEDCLIIDDSEDTSIKNCIFYNNDEYGVVWDNGTEGLYVSHSVFYENDSGNFDSPPTEEIEVYFADPLLDANYRPIWTETVKSPCIDTGNPDGEWDDDATPPDIGAVLAEAHDYFETTAFVGRVNYRSFPVIDRILNIGDDTDHILQEAESATQFYIENRQNEQMFDLEWQINLGYWSGNLTTLNSIAGYKIRTTDSVDIPTSGIVESDDTEITLLANQENWVGYFVEENMTIHDALSDVWQYVTAVHSEDWSWDNSGIYPSERCVMTKGDMYVIKVSEDCSFTYADGVPQDPKDREMTDGFSFEETMEYVPINVTSIDDPDIEEIAIFVGDECKGAAKVEEFPVQILAFLDEPARAEVTFEFYYGDRSYQRAKEYHLLDMQANKFVTADLELLPYQSETIMFGEPESVPATFSLSDNYPNPFNPTTIINYSIPNDTDVSLSIYNVKGQKVTTLVNGNQTAGSYNAVWNGTDDKNNKVSSGIYFYKITAGENSEMKKMVLIK